jgi:RNA polymerase sigma-32 factor
MAKSLKKTSKNTKLKSSAPKEKSRILSKVGAAEAKKSSATTKVELKPNLKVNAKLTAKISSQSKAKAPGSKASRVKASGKTSRPSKPKTSNISARKVFAELEDGDLAASEPSSISDLDSGRDSDRNSGSGPGSVDDSSFGSQTETIVEPGGDSELYNISNEKDILEDLSKPRALYDPEFISGEDRPLKTVSVRRDRSTKKNLPAVSGSNISTSDPMSVYMNEVRRYPLLTKEQEQELAIKYRETGDALAAESLVKGNLRFVVKVAAEYSKFGAKLIDLVQEGNVGLMHAVREFNPYKGVRLITYAVWWIRGYIQEYLMRQHSLVRIGTTQAQRKLFYKLKKERDLLTQMGQEPTVALLSSRLGVTEQDVETMSQRLSGRDISLSQPVGDESSNVTQLDMQADSSLSADDQLADNEMVQILKSNIEKIRVGLNEREIYLLENRLLADEPMTLQEVGDHYGVTREAVRQVEARLILKIKESVQNSIG